MANEKLANVRLKNARLLFRNFAGKADANGINKEGDRNVCVIIDDINLVEELKAEGWNIKQTKPREGYEDEYVPEFYVKANVKYRDKFGQLKAYPPMIYTVTDKKKTLLDENTVAQLDHAEIQDVRVELSPYPYEVLGRKGISVYVNKMYVKVIEDDFDDFEFDESDIEPDLD